MEPHAHVRYADKQRKSGRFEAAGNHYAAAADGYRMRFRHLSRDDPFDESEVYRSPKAIGGWARRLLLAALCYRLAEFDERCATHCNVGVLETRDLIDYETDFENSWQPPHIGLCYEMLGDFKLFGELNGWGDAYDEALRRYRRVENQLGWQSEPEFDHLIVLLLNLAEEVGYDVPPETATEIRYRSLEGRIGYKRRHYPNILEAVIEVGRLDSDTL